MSSPGLNAGHLTMSSPGLNAGHLTMSSPGLNAGHLTMSSPGLSAGAPKAAELFEDVWKHLRELHQNALQDLEAKVSKLKKERCLDAQKLEVFYKRSQQLKEQNKALQDTVSLLEERLRSGDCDGCASLKEHLKNSQDQNQHLVTKLKNERKILEDENRKLQAELQKVKTPCSEPQRASPPEQDDGVIPDSPVLHSSLPVANKLRKHRRDRSAHVRYAETHLRKANKSLFGEPHTEARKDARTAEVLVPNTCEYDGSQTSGEGNVQPEEAVAETCAFELFSKAQTVRRNTKSTDTEAVLEALSREKLQQLHLNRPTLDAGPGTGLSPQEPETAAGQQRLKPPQNSEAAVRPQRSLPPPLTAVRSPDATTDRSPSLLRPQEALRIKAKRKKEECEPTTQEDDKRAKREDESRGRSSSLGEPVFKEPPEKKSAQRRTTKQGSDDSPTFNRQQDGKDHKSAEATWSLDPALAVSMYDSEMAADERSDERRRDGELADTDCTWISHSLLQGRGQGAAAGLGHKAHDSLDLLFDTTACGEYESHSGSQLGQSQACEEEEEDEEEEEEDPEDPHESWMSQRTGTKAQRPTFAHVAVIRKKDERRKLKGTTCKECEIYYAHLPEEEKEKKLSACSRHRFLYVPPSTPENFWDVGFPSTQTCIKRGYIKEEKNPQARSRRRQPFNAFFSPKPPQEEPSGAASR